MTAKPRNEPESLPAPPCYVPAEEVARARESVVRWVPVLVTALIAIGSNAVFVSYLFGKMEQRLVPLERHCDESLSTYVTRAEFNSRVAQRDRELQTHNEWLTRIEGKLDRVLAAGRTGQ